MSRVQMRSAACGVHRAAVPTEQRERSAPSETPSFVRTSAAQPPPSRVAGQGRDWLAGRDQPGSPCNASAVSASAIPLSRPRASAATRRSSARFVPVGVGTTGAVAARSAATSSPA